MLSERKTTILHATVRSTQNYHYIVAVNLLKY